MTMQPEEYGIRDPVQKTLGIRNGEPKRSESLFEMPAVVPEVPEVSLCLLQDKNQFIQDKSSSDSGILGHISSNLNQKRQNQVLQKNPHESYNTWKARNAQALQDITGSLERTNIASKPSSISKRLGGIVRKQNSERESYSSQRIIPTVTDCTTRTNTNVELTHPEQENLPQHPISAPNQQHHSCSAERKINKGFYADNQSINHRNNHSENYSRNISKNVQLPQSIAANCSSPVSNQQHSYFHIQDRNLCNMPSNNYEVVENDSKNLLPGSNIQNYHMFGQTQCHCQQQMKEFNPVDVNYFLCPETGNSHKNQVIDPKTHYQWDPTFINNQLSSLCQTINFQNEQIATLCKEINSQRLLFVGMHEDIKKIHQFVSKNNITHDVSVTNEKSVSETCSCKQKRDNDCDTDHISSRNQSTPEDSSNQNTISATKPTDENNRKSVGVMTSALGSDSQVASSPGDCSKSHIVKDKTSSNYHRQVLSSPVLQKNKRPKDRKTIGEKKKLQPKHRRSRKEAHKKSNESDDSFSLNEAEVVLRTEQDEDHSPDMSIHVDMSDYSETSFESDTSDSSNSDDEGQDSGSEGGSSDPQIGWTFYDRVVGQVNNLLKKTSNDPHQEYIHSSPMRNPGNILYQCNGEFENENNWSKRVTFDGPPLEDSDNVTHMPKYHQYRAAQDYRINGVQERVPELMMYDYKNAGTNLSLANGSANLSFATYRYYQRHQLLPSHCGMKVPDPIFHEQQKFSKPITKKKKKSRKPEKTHPVSQKNYKKRNSGPPTKILDISTLKQQPKLF